MQWHLLTVHTHNNHFTALWILSGTTWVSQYQKGKTNLDSNEARDSEWQWHQLGNIQICTSPQTDNHTSNQTLGFLQARCPSCHSTNSIKALKARSAHGIINNKRQNMNLQNNLKTVAIIHFTKYY